MNLRIEEVQDPVVRDNFQRVESEIGAQPFLKGEWRFVEFSVPGAVTDYRYPHGLGFTPKDILVTSTRGAGAVTWSYISFTNSHLVLTTTGAVTIRAFVGSYFEG